MRRQSLALNAFLNGVRSVLNIIFPIITFPYISRVLSVSEIGKYNFSNSFVSYFILIAGLGISTYAVREGSKLRDNKEEISIFASQVFSINILSTLLSYVLLFFCLCLFDTLHKYTIVILILSIQILFTTIGTEWIYNIFEEYTYITVRSIAFKILSLILLFIFVRHQGDYLNYAAITVFSAVGSNVLNYLHAKQFCPIKLTLKVDLKKHIKPIFIIFSSSLATTIYLNLDTTLLGFMKNDYIVGIYSVSTKMYGIVKTLIAAVFLVSVPRFAFYLGKKKIDDFRQLLLQITNISAMISIPASVGVYMLAPQIVQILATSKYMRSVNSLRILCLALIFSTFSAIFTTCVLIPAKRESKVLLITFLAAIVNVILNLVLIPTFEENATAFTTSLSELISMILGIWYSKDLTRGLFIKEFWKDIGIYIVSSIFIIGICLLGNELFNSTVLVITFDLTLSILVYVLILAAVHNKFVVQLVKTVKERIS